MIVSSMGDVVDAASFEIARLFLLMIVSLLHFMFLCVPVGVEWGALHVWHKMNRRN